MLTRKPRNGQLAAPTAQLSAPDDDLAEPANGYFVMEFVRNVQWICKKVELPGSVLYSYAFLLSFKFG